VFEIEPEFNMVAAWLTDTTPNTLEKLISTPFIEN